MEYLSTRGSCCKVNAANAILKGLAEDGGLYVPDHIPSVNKEFIQSLIGKSYQERARKILALYLQDFSDEEIKACVENAYDDLKFDTPKIAPLSKLEDSNYVLELWHGPTSAFKDMALQMLPQLISQSLKKEGKKEELLILVATSGDTGKAALEGFKDVPQTKILVFYPNEGVSAIQKAQMTTQEGKNVSVIAIEGNFDDAQAGVKQIFSDLDFKKELLEKNVELSSANSINWGRLLPQIVYYFSAYADLVESGAILIGDKIDFVVPTGNFGNILAGYYAREMGLPIGKLGCASNANDVLTEFLKTGKYSRNRVFHKTISPSMDILVSSNLERLLYHITKDSIKVAQWMKELNELGSYTIDKDTLQKIQEIFVAGSLSDEATLEEIKGLYRETGYVIDPHTAVAWAVSKKYNFVNKKVILSTASPYKFNDSVLEALEISYKNKSEFQMLDALAEVNKNPIPKGLNMLRKLHTRFNTVCQKNDMKAQVIDFINGQP